MIREFTQHHLTRNHTSTLPSLVLFVDTETEMRLYGGDEHHYMMMGWSCFGRRRTKGGDFAYRWRYHTSPLEMWQYIDSLVSDGQKLYVFAHNAFFDLQASAFFQIATTLGWTLAFLYDKGLSYILSLRSGKRTLVVLSTTNFYPFSLRQLGDMVGLKKLDVDFDTVRLADLKIYCRRDVAIIKRVMMRHFDFIKSHDLGNFRLTRSSQAFAAYRHRFMDHPLTLHTESDISDLERSAYFGGRVECKHLGRITNGPFLLLDINSMYPYVMRHNVYPTRLVDYHESPSLSLMQQILLNRCVVAEVWIETDDPCYAVRLDNKVIFPVGTFKTSLCTEGVNYAISKGHVRRFGRVASYERAQIFSTYIDYFYKLRLEAKASGDMYLSQLAKDYLNHLYGKFGQKRPITDITDIADTSLYQREVIRDLVTGKDEIITSLLGKQLVTWDEDEGKQAFVAIAAHVTEHARMHLYRLMRIMGLEDTLYTDTDSLMIRKRDVDRLRAHIDPDRLGALKIEGEFESLVLHGPKDYERGGEVKIKGVPKRAQRLTEGTYRYWQFQRQVYHLQHRNSVSVVMREVQKRLRRDYTKGQVDSSGRVHPLRLEHF